MANQARQDQKKREVKVDRERLLETLKSNREKHIQQYEEALAGYQEQALAKLQKAKETALARMEKNFQKVQLDLEDFDPESKTSDYIELIQSEVIHLPVPRNYSKEYDAAIDIAQWEVEETMTLTFAEFQCFVRDVWEWSEDFYSNTVSYTKG